MPFYSDLSNSNMYYSGMPSYSSASSYGYSGSSLPLGVSYSASYLNPGGSYSTHSSLGGYGRTPLSSRWISTSRAYSPMLSTISERGASSPVRINSPRRIPLTNKTYSTTSYSPRPININTADIDVSRDKYRAKHNLNRPPISPTASVSSDVKQGVTNNSYDNGPFMPRVDGKPETGIDSSPGQRSTIHRGRTVVRLYTVKRKERDSPRKPLDAENSLQQAKSTKDVKSTSLTESGKAEHGKKGISSKNELSEDLARKDKNQKKIEAEKLTEKFKAKEKGDTSDVTVENNCLDQKNVEEHSDNSNTLTTSTVSNTGMNKSPDRRCSMELLAEQAHLLDSLIRNENLSTATLDLSKLGTKDDKSQIFNFNANTKERNVNRVTNRLQTTKSDHSLHNRLKSSTDSKESQHFPKRRSLKKSSSGGSIRRLDSITEFAKESLQNELPVIEESRLSCKSEILKAKPKVKPKITSSVDTSQSTSPLKFRVENIIVEEKVKVPKKEIIFSSTVDVPKDESKLYSIANETINDVSNNKKMSNKAKKTKFGVEKRASEEGNDEDCDFWDKIGKRETIYIKKRQEKIQKDILKHRAEIFWSPEEESEIDEKNEQNRHLDLSSQKNVQNYLDVSNCKLNLEKKHDVTDFELGDPKNIDVEIIKPEKNKMKEIVLPESVKQEQLDITKRFPRDVLESNINRTQLDSTLLYDIVNENSPLVQDHNINNTINVTNNENNVKSESKLEEPTQEHYASHMLVNKESEVEATTKLITEEISNEITRESKVEATTKLTEKLSNELTGINKQMPSLKYQTLQKEKLVYNTIELTKSNSINTTLLNAQLHNAKISTIEDPKTSNKKQLPTLAPHTTPEAEHTSNGPVFEGMIVEEDKDEKKLEGTIKINDVSQSGDPINSIVENIPNKDGSLLENDSVTIEGTGEENKADNRIPEDGSINVNVLNKQSQKCVIQLPTSPKKRLVKDEPALRPLIATPRPLQKKKPQIIHSSSSSESSSEEESSDEDDDADESDESEESAQFFDCENNLDGRTSTGSNDSGFDSSAPTSPAGFVFIKKDCDVNCHRKCEKLTANLCGVNQRLLAEALATRSSRRGGESPGAGGSGGAPSKPNANDILEQELEASTAYGLFRKTGRFTPPARSIPRFRKYVIDDFHFIKVLGKGSFGKVLLAELRDTEYYYAVKCLKKDVVLEDDDVECTLIERKVLALGTNHPYLCHLFATFQTDSHLFFVMEYLNGGDLMFHIQQSGRFPEARARFYAAEIVSGLKFLHKRGIVYRDLKLDNILLDYEGHVRIADFGMCKLQIYLDKTADTFCGTPDYMAPEIIKGLKYNQAVDWWSFGVLLYEMLIGQSPFSGCDEDELFWSICNEMPSYPRFLSTEALTVLTRLLDKDACTRLGGAECMYGDIRDQDFFRPIHWDRLERRELETPFKPRVRHPLDTQYFDRAFTGERPRLTAVEPQVLRSMDQEPFRGFSYTNPNATDR